VLARVLLRRRIKRPAIRRSAIWAIYTAFAFPRKLTVYAGSSDFARNTAPIGFFERYQRASRRTLFVLPRHLASGNPQRAFPAAATPFCPGLRRVDHYQSSLTRNFGACGD
jgi:hypothetical protein